MPGLGKGLDALIPSGSDFSSQPGASGVTQVSIQQITPNPRQPRAVFGVEELAELSASIKEHGIIQPLIVTGNDFGDGYILIAGERRWQAAKQAGLSQVPVIIRQATDQQRLELALIENIQRADLNPLEEAHACQSLVDEFGLSHETIAKRLGKSRVAVTNTLRLLKLPDAVQKALINEDITEGHARALLGLEDAKSIEQGMRTLIALNMNVRSVESMVRLLVQLPNSERVQAALATIEKQKLDIAAIDVLVQTWMSERPVRSSPKTPPPPDIVDLQNRIESSLGNKAVLRVGDKGKGTLTLHFFSNEELDTILARILSD